MLDKATATQDAMTNTDSVDAIMARLGETARAAARGLANAPSAQKDKALHAMAAAIRASTDAILTANAKDVAAMRASGQTAAFLDRGTLTTERIDDIAAGIEAIAALADPVGDVIAAWERPNGLQIRAGAHAARRHRRHLRKPPQRDGGRRCAVPEGRERGDPARRLGQFSFLSRHRACLARGLVEAGLPEGAIQLVPTTRPGRRRRMLKVLTAYRRHRAARRQEPDRAGSEREPRSGVRPSGRPVPCLRRQGRRSGEGQGHRCQRQDAAHRHLRRGGNAARRPRLRRHASGAVWWTR